MALTDRNGTTIALGTDVFGTVRAYKDLGGNLALVEVDGRLHIVDMGRCAKAIAPADLAPIAAHSVYANVTGAAAAPAVINASNVPVLIVSGSTFGALGWRLSDLALGVWVL